MKRWLGLLAFALAAPFAHSQQYGLYQTCQFQTPMGQAVAGAQVYFLTQPANTSALTPQAQVYSSSTGGTVNQPILTNGQGTCTAYLSPGTYTVCYVSQYTGTQCNPDQNVPSPTPGTYAVTSVTILTGGDYSVCPTGVAFSGGEGEGAAGTPICTGTAVTSVTMTAGGSYINVPSVSFTGGSGAGASGVANLTEYPGVVPIATGGTGATTIATAQFNLGLGTAATQSTVSLNGRISALSTTCKAAGNFPLITGTATISLSTPTTLTMASGTLSPSTPNSQTVVIPGAGAPIYPAWQASYSYTKGTYYTNAGTAYYVTTAYSSGTTFGTTDTTNSYNLGAGNYQLVSTITYVNSTTATLATAATAAVTAVAFEGGIDDTTALNNCATATTSANNSLYLPAGTYLITKHLDLSIATWGQGGVWLFGDARGTPTGSGYTSGTTIIDALTEPYAAIDMTGDYNGGVENIIITPLYTAPQNTQATSELLVYQGAQTSIEAGQKFTIRDFSSYGAVCPGCAAIALPNVDEDVIENTHVGGGIVVGAGLGVSTNVASGVYPTGAYSVASRFPSGLVPAGQGNTTKVLLIHDSMGSIYVPTYQLTGSADYTLVDDYCAQGGAGIAGVCIELENSLASGEAANALHISGTRVENQTTNEQAGNCVSGDPLGCGMIALNYLSRSTGGIISACLTTDTQGALLGFNASNATIENTIYNLTCGTPEAYFNISGAPYILNDTFYIAIPVDSLYTGTMGGVWDYNTFRVSVGSTLTSSAIIGDLPAGNKGDCVYHGDQDSACSVVSSGASSLTAFRYSGSNSQPSAPWTQLGEWVMGSTNTSVGDTLSIDVSNGYGFNSGYPSEDVTHIVVRGANGYSIPNIAGVSWWSTGRQGGIQNVKVVDCSASPGTSSTNGTWCIWVLSSTNALGTYTVSTETTTSSGDTWTDTSSTTNGADPTTASLCSPVSNCVITSTTGSGTIRGIDGTIYGTASAIQTQYGSLNFAPLTNPTTGLAGLAYTTGGSIPAGTYSYTYAISADGSTWTNQNSTALSETLTGSSSSVLLQLSSFANITGANYVMWCRGGYKLTTTTLYQGGASFLDTLASATGTACPSSNNTQGYPKLNGAAPGASGGLALYSELPITGYTTLASGTVTVSNAAACTPSATCTYHLQNCGTNSSAALGTLTVGTITAGTSFVINSESAAAAVVTSDNSHVCWSIIP